MSGRQTPAHLSDIDDHILDIPDRRYILDRLTAEDINEFHRSFANQVDGRRDTIKGGPGKDVYLILGNYDEPQKTRLREAQNLIEYFNSRGVALLLEELEPDQDVWSNFYLKFRLLLACADFAVLIAEDNDGGHELELGEVPLTRTCVVKRDYKIASIREDIERDKYDAMLAKLFEVLDKHGQLFKWHDIESFCRSLQNMVDQTARNP